MPDGGRPATEEEAVAAAINLEEKLASFDEHWAPRIVGSFNGHDLMVVKVLGEFVWHDHQDTDDFFMVLKGALTIEMPDGSVSLGPGGTSPPLQAASDTDMMVARASRARVMRLSF